MKIICTESEKKNIIDAFNGWCPFDIKCPYPNENAYDCSRCINEHVEFEIKDADNEQTN